MSDVSKGIRNTVIMFVVFGLLALIGLSKFSWALIIAAPLLCGGAAYVFSKGNMKAVLRWSILGLVAGVGFYLAI